MALNPADIAAISRLLDEALALEPAEREPWLAALPAEHQRHADALRDMLAQEAQLDTDPRLEAMPKLPTDEAVAHAGDRIGPYRLMREVGRGGMGSVWLAERADGAYKRQVALKLPRLAWGAGLAERMAREREIGMLLEHPNIARLYDAGVDERGRPYLGLEFVDGQPIDAWCEAKGLGVRDRLSLFVQVVKAVAYAHGRLVVHRDLKPSNVLVTPDGQAHLLDFGIAKLLQDVSPGEVGLTQEQGRVMTPQYASPEQVAGEPITVQSDVYSLGVLLYELLTGTLPIAPKRRTLGAVEDAILEGDAPAASGRVKERVTAKALRGEVDAILAKAMQREPQRRYVTADALAQDIERHLRGDTVSARPDSAGYRLGKLIVRHKWGIGATAVVVVVAVAGVGGATLHAYRAAQQAERARAVTDLVSDMLRAGSRPVPGGPSSSGSPEGAVLDQGARLIEARFPGQPDLQAELYGVVSRVYADIGASKLAMDYAVRQIAALDRLPPDVPRRVRALLLLANAAMTEGRVNEGEAHVRQSIVQAGSNRMLAAEGQALWARIAIELGRLDEARASAALAEVQLLGSGAAPTIAAAWLLDAQARLRTEENRFDESGPLFDSAVQMALQAEGALSRFATDLQVRRAKSLLDRGRYAQSRQQIDPALERLHAGGSVDHLRAAVESARYWARTYEMRLVGYEQVWPTLARIRSSLPVGSEAVHAIARAEVEFSLAPVQIQHGDVADAEVSLAASLPVLRPITDQLRSHFAFAAYEGSLAMLLGDHVRADTALRAALELRSRLGQAKSPYTSFDWARVALNSIMRGEAAAAQSLLGSAPDFGIDAASGLSCADVIQSMRARAQLERGDAEGALKTIPDSSRTADDDYIEMPDRGLLGEALCAAGKASEGLKALQSSIQSLSKFSGDHHPGLVRLRALAGLCALSLGNRKQAVQLANHARRGLAVHPRFSPWFEQPLLKLERALGHGPSAKDDPSIQRKSPTRRQAPSTT